MSNGDLLFSLAPNGSPNLLFGEAAALGSHDATLAAALPSLTLSAFMAPDVRATISTAFPVLTAAIAGEYASHAMRPMVGEAASGYQVAAPVETGAQAAHQGAPQLAGSATVAFARAAPLSQGIKNVLPGTLVADRSAIAGHHAEALAVRAQRSLPSQDALRDRRLSRRSGFFGALRIDGLRSRIESQDGLHASRAALRAHHAEAIAISTGRHWQNQRPLRRLTGRESLFDNAMRPPAGMWSPGVITPPGDHGCYARGVTLLFRWPQSASDLLFICDNWAPPPSPNGKTVVIPIRKAYIVVNDIALIRRENNLALPALALSINIDADSWTWGWQARLPAKHLDDVLPATPGAPVGFEAVVNGVHWYLLAEKVQRDRAFPQDRVAISGRGIAAELGSPYALLTSRNNSIDRTARQLMDDALTINGVSIGWALDWNMTDWLVPGGVWNHKGSHIEAINRIAEAAGGYVQAHRTSKVLAIKPRYPVAPWHWNTVTPDFSLPAAVTTKQGIQWIQNPDYNAVWVSGESAGILASVTRQGSAGDLAAPMIVDALNTHADASRQRGTSILSAAGSQQLLTLETPILPDVGIYPVGSFVQFADGANSRLGIVRSLAISAGKQTRQTIEVECHE